MNALQSQTLNGILIADSQKKHMTCDKILFSTFSPKEGRLLSYRNNNKEKNLGVSTIGKSHSPMVGKFLLVREHKHNILSISQLCGKRSLQGHKI